MRMMNRMLSVRANICLQDIGCDVPSGSFRIWLGSLCMCTRCLTSTLARSRREIYDCFYQLRTLPLTMSAGGGGERWLGVAYGGVNIDAVYMSFCGGRLRWWTIPSARPHEASTKGTMGKIYERFDGTSGQFMRLFSSTDRKCKSLLLVLSHACEAPNKRVTDLWISH